MDKLHYDGPVVLVVMDGVGLAPTSKGNAVADANTPFLNNACKNYPHIMLEASDEAVGLANGEIGNSEVGHNTIGCGQIIKQGITYINDEFKSGKIWRSNSWKEAILKARKSNSTLHFSGIFSDGGQHSHIDHLKKMIERAYDEGIRKIRLHCVFDGRDVSPQSAEKYINEIENFFHRFPTADFKIASGVGRMIGMSDRYEADWNMVKIGWNMMHGIADKKYHSAMEGIEDLRKNNPEIQDQNLPAFVVLDKNENPIGKIEEGDSVIYYDFRADRAVEISRVFTDKDFDKFDRGHYLPSDVYFVGLAKYDIEKNIPENTLTEPIKFRDTLTDFLSSHNISQLAISETVKFGHITYYFNGCSYEKFPGEKQIEIKSDNISFDKEPKMKAVEITDQVIANIGKYNFIRINYPNGDMVGHTANIDATKIAIETVDSQLERIAKEIDKLNGCMIITADHGNAEELLDETGKEKTSHTKNPVPFIIYDNTKNREKYIINDIKDKGLSNIAATVATLFNRDDYPKNWRDSLIVLK